MGSESFNWAAEVSHTRYRRQANHHIDFVVQFRSTGRCNVEHGGTHWVAYVYQFGSFSRFQDEIDVGRHVIQAHFVVTGIQKVKQLHDAAFSFSKTN